MYICIYIYWYCKCGVALAQTARWLSNWSMMFTFTGVGAKINKYIYIYIYYFDIYLHKCSYLCVGIYLRRERERAQSKHHGFSTWWSKSPDKVNDFQRFATYFVGSNRQTNQPTVPQRDPVLISADISSANPSHGGQKSSKSSNSWTFFREIKCFVKDLMLFGKRLQN